MGHKRKNRRKNRISRRRRIFGSIARSVLKRHANSLPSTDKNREKIFNVIEDDVKFDTFVSAVIDDNEEIFESKRPFIDALGKLINAFLDNPQIWISIIVKIVLLL